MIKRMKIMKTPPPLSEDEILKFKDFEKLLSDNEAVKLRKRKSARVKQTAIVTGVLMLLSVVWYMERAPREPGQKVTQEMDGASTAPDRVKATDEQSRPSESRKEGAEEKTTTREESQKENREIPRPAPPGELAERTNDEKDSDNIEDKYIYVEAEPENGFPALYQYFNRELTYPDQALKDSIQGVVTVSFVIDKQGKPTEISIVNSLGSAFEAEARRVIERMPKWKPATVNGTPVPSRLSLPLTFEIVTNKTKP